MALEWLDCAFRSGVLVSAGDGLPPKPGAGGSITLQDSPADGRSKLQDMLRTDGTFPSQTVRTERLILRPPAPSDLEELYQLQSDPRVWAHFPAGRFHDPSRTAAWVDAKHELWLRNGLDAWTVRDLNTEEFYGYGGCSLQNGSSNEARFWNLGYRLRPEAHGRGLATELARAALQHVQRIDAGIPVVAYMAEDNAASGAVARKAGLVLQHRGPDPDTNDSGSMTVRLVFADRALSGTQLASTTTHRSARPRLSDSRG